MTRHLRLVSTRGAVRPDTGRPTTPSLPRGQQPTYCPLFLQRHSHMANQMKALKCKDPSQELPLKKIAFSMKQREKGKDSQREGRSPICGLIPTWMQPGLQQAKTKIHEHHADLTCRAGTQALGSPSTALPRISAESCAEH